MSSASAAPLVSVGYTEQKMWHKAWVCTNLPMDWLGNRVVDLRGFFGVKERARTLPKRHQKVMEA